ncbi:hypothetical protein FB567DRAFT_27318 [Paraphoma chrysanthemicola]|uniref:Uncharacterized protein n=1 Tax=Paraphoma chrysanthemicola TaxID=798071 RepID=A0A8K0W4X6_9PLEO|nr:hypothetical protein FB567DRAFT_27318 [Paraphoma chrysanthemicola]
MGHITKQVKSIADIISEERAEADAYMQSLRDSDDPVPDVILAEPIPGLYRICWKPDKGGVIVVEPCLISAKELLMTQEDLVRKHPDLDLDLVGDWERKQRIERKGAEKVADDSVEFWQRFMDNTTNFCDEVEHDHEHNVEEEPPEVCGQRLFPGMSQHWGDLRKCERHPDYRPAMSVCKGCRVAHYTLESETFDRALIMAQGARVPVCRTCAARVLEAVPFQDSRCVCDSEWTCFRCREAELEKLAAARKGHVEGRCGLCRKGRDFVRHFDICLCCKRVRVYMMEE